ncbi:LRRC49 isoform 23 [Pan troglodytes]|uniref:Leucine rich repeat containing 49 n=2 Tax=Homininae TaxID=207598 RepID=H0YMT2_HUMAN|nr:leucine rich repeat containing 49 [Homo sapiens]KAI4058526.1 leucine rich repeat containing 49 [Homo sapiens]PNI74109.1 LRRC49 isoform 23 [Pan troglodytes]
MIPGKYRSVSGRAANNVNCGLHLVIQTSSLPEKNKTKADRMSYHQWGRPPSFVELSTQFYNSDTKYF